MGFFIVQLDAQLF